MHDNLDPRLWNLFAGAALLSAGCGARVIGQDGGETGETTLIGEGEAEAEAEAEAESETPPECIEDSDCGGSFYYCYDGVCEYVPHHDGWLPYYDCYSDEECGEFELCVFGYCESQGEPPADCESPSMGIPIASDEALALTFADVDADGQDELVVATAASLVVHEFGGGGPTVTARAPGEVQAMVAGSFDAMPGEDVLLLSGDQLQRYGSNGDGSFSGLVESGTPIVGVDGLIAGDLDPVMMTDVLGWGAGGSYLSLGAGVVIATDQAIDAAAAFEIDAAVPGFAVRRGDTLDVFDLAGQLSGSSSGLFGPSSVAAYTGAVGVGYVNLNLQSAWTRVLLVDPVSAGWQFDWVIPGQPGQILAGDLDGDTADELVFNYEAGVAIEFDPGGAGECWDSPIMPTPNSVRGVAFGDHDGDGDLELGILSSVGEVVLIDGG